MGRMDFRAADRWQSIDERKRDRDDDRRDRRGERMAEYLADEANN